MKTAHLRTRHPRLFRVTNAIWNKFQHDDYFIETLYRLRWQRLASKPELQLIHQVLLVARPTLFAKLREKKQLVISERALEAMKRQMEFTQTFSLAA